MSTSWKILRTVTPILAVIFFTVLVLVLMRIQTNAKHLPTAISGTATKFVLKIPQKALLKNYVVVSAIAVPGTNCELLYVPPSGKTQLMETISNKEGRCEWRWKIEEAEGKGAGRLIFTIDGKSETHFFEILSGF